VSKPLSEHIENYCRKACIIEVVENAVDYSVFKPMPKSASRKKLSLPEGAVLIGTAGALSENRGIGVLYRAYQLLLSDNSDIHLVLAGRRSKKVPIPDFGNIHYLGELAHSDIAHFYNALDVAIVALTESAFGRYCFPQKACEILACKRPLVSTSVGVMKDLLKGYPECLFEDGKFEMLAEKIMGQLNKAVVPDVVVPDWADQARKIKILVERVSKIPFPD
jgi:glycosyltransferase involved in cell wall biosynthesis